MGMLVFMLTATMWLSPDVGSSGYKALLGWRAFIFKNTISILNYRIYSYPTG